MEGIGGYLIEEWNKQQEKFWGQVKMEDTFSCNGFVNILIYFYLESNCVVYARQQVNNRSQWVTVAYFTDS